MASLTRSDYERVFYFAANVYARLPVGNLSRQAVAIMDLVEGCIGQMPSRPDIVASPRYSFVDFIKHPELLLTSKRERLRSRKIGPQTAQSTAQTQETP